MKKRKKSQDKRWKTTIWIFFTFVYNYPLSSNPCNFQCTFDTENRHGAIGVKRRPEAPDDRSSRFVDYRFSVAAESTIRESQQFAGSVHTAQVHVTSSGWYRFSERVEPATTWHDDVKEVTFRTSGVRKAHFGHFSATGLSIRERRRQTISVRLREEFSEGGGVGGGRGERHKFDSFRERIRRAMTASFKIGFLNSITRELIVLVAGPEVLNRCLSLISGFRTKIIRRLGKNALVFVDF